MLILSFLVFGITIIEKNKSNLFCLLPVNIVDFYPWYDYFVSNDITTDEYNQRLTDFYLCQARKKPVTNDMHSDNISRLLVANVTLIRTIIGIITVPIINSILFFKYVQKYRQLSHSIANASLQIKSTVTVTSSNNNININNSSDSDHDQKDEKTSDICTDDKHDRTVVIVPLSMQRHINVNLLLGIASVSTTLLTLVLLSLSSFFAILVYIDGWLNGIFMICSLDFGEWIVKKCCTCCLKKLTHIAKK